MISGATRGAGGPALGTHLADAASNEAVLTLEGRGLVSRGIKAQVAELTRTEQQAASIRRMTGTIAQTHELAGQAVGLLHELATPKPEEGPNQIDELLQTLMAVVESQRRIE